MDDALLQELEADPSNIDAYLVYADHLQAQGDPRGELIAYHHALRLTPGVGSAQREAQRLIDTHRHAWLGAAVKAGHARCRVDWFMGFPERVQLALPTIAASVRLLEQLITSDAFRLVQRIDIEINISRANESVFDPGAFWDLLRKHARPRALRSIRIGEPGRARVPEELLRLFPRLRERPELSWQLLRESIREQQRLKTSFEQTKLPGLTLLDPSLGLEVDTHELVLGLRAELDKQRQLGVLEAMQRLFTPGSLDHLCIELMRAWERKGAPGGQRWVLDVAAALGGDQSSAYLAPRLGRWSHQRAKKATEVLVELGAPMGLNEIYALSWGEDSVSKHAAQVLERMAKNRRVTVAAVLDRAVPRDPDRETLARFVTIQARWLEDLMINGHRLARADFMHFVAAGPRLALAAGLVWGLFRGERCVASVSIDAEGRITDSAGAPAGVPADARVGLLHPMEFEASERRAWLEHFARTRVTQPFAQLRRPQLRLRPSEHGHKNLYRFAKRPAGPPTTSYDGGRWTQWQNYDIENERTNYGYELRLTRGHQRMSAVAVYETEGERVFNRQRRHWGDVDPILVSELLVELERVTTLPWARLELSVELRDEEPGKCLVCEGELARGQLCVGLMRPRLELYNRKGRRRDTPRVRNVRVWGHWACAEAIPELQLAIAQADVAGRLRELRAPFGELPAAALEPGGTTPPAPPASAPPPGTASLDLDEASVLARCPDSKAVAASKRTAKASSWDDTGHGEGITWGVCKGSKASDRYRVGADLHTLTVRCSCPSRKRPCKHGIALLLLFARGEVSEERPPSWARSLMPTNAR